MNSKMRQTLYFSGTIVTGIVSVALIWGGLSTESAAGITQAITGLLTLLGGTAVTATAGAVTGKQRHDGILDNSPVEQVLGGLFAITEARDKAVADFDVITKAATDTLGQIPALGPLSQQLIDQLRTR